jgi:hypothetical protein
MNRFRSLLSSINLRRYDEVQMLDSLMRLHASPVPSRLKAALLEAVGAVGGGSAGAVADLWTRLEAEMIVQVPAASAAAGGGGGGGAGMAGRNGMFPGQQMGGAMGGMGGVPGAPGGMGGMGSPGGGFGGAGGGGLYGGGGPGGGGGGGMYGGPGGGGGGSAGYGAAAAARQQQSYAQQQQQQQQRAYMAQNQLAIPGRALQVHPW